MGRTATARQALADLLTPVWPGRVHPYPPTRPAPAAGLYVTTFEQSDDGVTWNATFTVRLVADGANHAAHALLDDMVDAVYDAVANTPEGVGACIPDAVTFEPFDVDDVTSLAAYTFTVEVQLTGSGTWCSPDPPAAVTIPPVPIGA